MERVINVIKGYGITSIFDMSCLQQADWAAEAQEVRVVLEAAVQAAKGRRQRYVREVATRPKRVEGATVSVKVAPVVASTSRTSRAYQRLAVNQATMGNGGQVEPMTPSIRQVNTDLVAKFLEQAHEFFVTELHSSPRYAEVMGVDGGAREAYLGVQRNCYTGRSQSVPYMMAWLKHAKEVVEGLKNMQVDMYRMSAFQVAAYVCSRTEGLKLGTARNLASSIRSAMSWLTEVTGAEFHGDDRVVKSQSKLAIKSSGQGPKSALCWTEEMVMGFEEQVDTAPTPQLRCLAGACAFLAHSSHRACDGLRVKDIGFTKDARHGMSLVKSGDQWKPWVVTLDGFSDPEDPWSTRWWSQLGMCGLPGEDYLLNAFNEACDRWIPRPAATSDMERGLRMLLMLPPHMMPVDEVDKHSIHGARHLYVTALTQMGSKRGELCRAGGWAPPSAMPEAYDSKANVAQLKMRAKVASAIASGWRVAPAHTLPAPVPSKRRRTSVGKFYVVHAGTGKVHRYCDHGKAVCGWACGLVDALSEFAVFFSVKPEGHEWCESCR